MRRPERQDTLRERLARIRAAVPDVAIRTTCIVGFPGETESDFETLLAFLEEAQFDRAGAFAYSPQEGTRAVAMADDVPDTAKRERLERVLELQRQITIERAERHVGRTVAAIVDRVGDDGTAQGRVLWQADDIDGVTYIEGIGLRPGMLVDVTLRGVSDDGDFDARLARMEVQASVAPRRSRRLPVATTIGSFGR